MTAARTMCEISSGKYTARIQPTPPNGREPASEWYVTYETRTAIDTTSAETMHVLCAVTRRRRMKTQPAVSNAALVAFRHAFSSGRAATGAPASVVGL